MKGSKQPSVHDLQRQLKQSQLDTQKQIAQVTALLMGKGKGKGHDKGKGKSSGQDKGKGKGKGNNAWAKAFSFGIQVRANDLAKAFYSGEQAALDARIAKAANADIARAASGKEILKSTDVEMEEQADQSQTRADTLSTMGLHPAPLIAEVKPYPRPKLRAAVQEVANEAADQIAKLESSFQDAKSKGFSAAILKVYSQELATLKGAQPKVAKPGQSKGVLLTQLQRRLEMADKMSQNALDRHNAQLEALDEQTAQLKAIREFKARDFSETQKAFAARLVEDRQALADLRAELDNLVGEGPDKKAQEVNEGVQTAIEDLARHFDVASTELPACPDVEEASEKKALESLWHLYSQLSFAEVPSLTFDALQLSPSFAHTLVGDKVWNGFWTTKATSVTGGQFIPKTLHNYLKYVVQAKGQMITAKAAMETAQQRINAARSLATERKLAGNPY